MGWSYYAMSRDLAKNKYIQTHSYERDPYQAFENRWRYANASTPGIGWIYNAQDRTQFMIDYTRNRNIDWSDMKYPTMQIGAGGYGDVINRTASSVGYTYVSKNLMSFYRSGYRSTPYNHWSYR